MVAPGGMGTLDELFEVLTLKQTGKVQPDMPVVLFGKEFWKSIISWDALADYGVISQVRRGGVKVFGKLVWNPCDDVRVGDSSCSLSVSSVPVRFG